MSAKIDEKDRAIIRATQHGLPLVSKPYDEVAKQVGIPTNDVIERISKMLDQGIIRRIGVVPNHYALGLTHNAMTVWDIDDEQIAELGQQIGDLKFVTHCYQRPRRLPIWPYNLFAMVHGTSDDEINDKITIIAERVGSACKGHDVLVSKRILKKTGLRLAA